MYKNKKVINEKGAISVFVTIAVLSIVIVLMALFFTSSSVRKSQLLTVLKIKQAYEADNERAGDIYSNIVDDKVPSASITVNTDTILENDSVYIEIVQADNKELDLSKCKYVINTSETNIGLDEQQYTGGEITTKTANLNFTASQTGTYYMHLLTKDKSGNATETISAPIEVVKQNTTTYSIANSREEPYYTYTVPVDGEYKLQVWGAQGGYRSTQENGGKGGYSEGIIKLTKGTNLYVYVGGAGGNSTSKENTIQAGGYNGGGYRYGYKGGGGATDIRFVSGNWNSRESLLSRVIVAGGGGSDGAADKEGMYAGGRIGGSSTQNYTAISEYGGKGGKQTYSGYSPEYTIETQATTGLDSNNKEYYCGGFGFGGAGIYLNEGYGGAGGRRLVWRFRKCTR